jgi:hypothetical protein
MRLMLKTLLAGLALIGVAYSIVHNDGGDADAAPFHFRAR